jgi:hypothetical protein
MYIVRTVQYTMAFKNNNIWNRFSSFPVQNYHSSILMTKHFKIKSAYIFSLKKFNMQFLESEPGAGLQPHNFFTQSRSHAIDASQKNLPIKRNIVNRTIITYDGNVF